MRKALVLLIVMAISGCAQLSNVETAIQLGTASVANPVTKSRLNQMEQATEIVFVGLNAWKKACVNGVLPATCRQQIRAAQVYTMQIPPYLADLRRFVKNNDQINAQAVWNSTMDIIATVKAQAAAGGAPIAGG